MKIGDMVMIHCLTGLGTGGKAKITNVKTKYDQVTGQKYKVICCGTHEFHRGTGEAMTPPWAYYI